MYIKHDKDTSLKKKKKKKEGLKHKSSSYYGLKPNAPMKFVATFILW